MPNEPYRPDAPPDELARLAQEGQRRIAAASQAQAMTEQADANYNLRVAIGSLRGSWIRRLFLTLFILSLAMLATGIVLANLTDDKDIQATAGGIAATGFFGWIPSMILFLVLAPRATRGQIERERQWVRALPFALDGYFEVLSAEPTYSCQLRAELTWQQTPVDAATLQGLVGLLDTSARVLRADGHGASFTTGDISGTTGIAVNRSPVLRNHKVARELARIVEIVLVPLHRNRGLARVRVSRG